MAAAKSKAIELEVGDQLVRVSNRDKPYFPARGITKGQVVEYYRTVAPVLLRVLRDRPVVLKRYVDGVEVKYDGNGAPWSGAWDSRTIGNGQHKIFAKARDSRGNWSTSPSVGFTVAN